MTLLRLAPLIDPLQLTHDVPTSPDHSTLSKTCRFLDYETHLAVFGRVLQHQACQLLLDLDAEI
jgi:hypothetical protein